jgi:hypothetical protein
MGMASGIAPFMTVQHAPSSQLYRARYFTACFEAKFDSVDLILIYRTVAAVIGLFQAKWRWKTSNFITLTITSYNLKAPEKRLTAKSKPCQSSSDRTRKIMEKVLADRLATEALNADPHRKRNRRSMQETIF